MFDERLEFVSQPGASAKEARLDGAFRESEAACGGGHIHLVGVIEGERLAIFCGKRLHSLVNSCVLVAVLETAVDVMGIGGFVDFVERKRDRRMASQLGA